MELDACALGMFSNMYVRVCVRKQEEMRGCARDEAASRGVDLMLVVLSICCVSDTDCIIGDVRQSCG